MLKVLIYTGCFLAVVGLSLYGINKLYQYGWTGGWNTSEKEWREKQVIAQEDKIHAIKTYRDAMRSQAIDFADKVEMLENRNEEDNKYAEMARDSLMDSIMSGRIKLYHPVRARTQPIIGIDGGRSEHEDDLNVAASRCAGETQGELRLETTAFLFTEGNRANELVGDYNYLVDYINLIRASCAAHLE